MKWYRHGYVIIKPISKEEYDALSGLAVKKDYVLAYGEATGHHHKLKAKSGHAQVMVTPGTTEAQAFSLQEKTTLVHEEHKAIDIPKGYYKVEFEKEYEPLEQVQRRVYD